jgi:hypothetical protein
MQSAFTLAALWTAIFRLLCNAPIIPATFTVIPSVILLVSHIHPHS